MSNYLNARGYCRCGAFAFSDWRECTCNLGKATIEFRVFNATANLRKVHAFTALSLALVEYVANDPLGDFSPDNFPVFEWNGTTKTPPNEEASKRALAFIFEDLPLTEGEREDLRYCVENSSLALCGAELFGESRELCAVSA